MAEDETQGAEYRLAKIEDILGKIEDILALHGDRFDNVIQHAAEMDEWRRIQEETQRITTESIQLILEIIKDMRVEIAELKEGIPSKDKYTRSGIEVA